jgi:hypothetical protein
MTEHIQSTTQVDERRKPVCLLAPEWAEHARMSEDAEICDDGRQGVSCGNREGDPPCPISDRT